ncbi:MAG: dTDP-4-dehydrorhamnose reductase [Rikenellaceae bacterium]
MKNIMVTGANGQLGNEIQQLSIHQKQMQFFFTDVDKLDITSFEQLETFILAHNIDCIINCAAYTNVEAAEDNKQLSNEINHLGAKTLALCSLKHETTLVHVSTDYVFDGSANEPYKEQDAVNPKNVYGSTKLEGERAIIDSGCKSIIVRTSWLYSSHGNNFLKTMLKLGNTKEKITVVSDQIGTPTWAADLAAAIITAVKQLSSKPLYGEIFHYSNQGVCSWYDFAKQIMDTANLNCMVEPVDSSQYPTKAARPAYSVMDKSKIKAHFGISIPQWQESVSKCIELIK